MAHHPFTDNVISQLLAWRSTGRKAALVTLVAKSFIEWRTSHRAGGEIVEPLAASDDGFVPGGRAVRP